MSYNESLYARWRPLEQKEDMFFFVYHDKTPKLKL